MGNNSSSNPNGETDGVESLFEKGLDDLNAAFDEPESIRIQQIVHKLREVEHCERKSLLSTVTKLVHNDLAPNCSANEFLNLIKSLVLFLVAVDSVKPPSLTEYVELARKPLEDDEYAGLWGTYVGHGDTPGDEISLWDPDTIASTDKAAAGPLTDERLADDGALCATEVFPAKYLAVVWPQATKTFRRYAALDTDNANDTAEILAEVRQRFVPDVELQVDVEVPVATKGSKGHRKRKYGALAFSGIAERKVDQSIEPVSDFKIVQNGRKATQETLKCLVGLRNLFARQLPQMGKEYITRTVFDFKHRNLVFFRNNRIIGGICFREFHAQSFAEIVFCAIMSDEQVKGFGSLLMNNLKASVASGHIWNLLTYADNAAVGYFKKQGFSTDIQMRKDNYVGHVKDYEGGVLMHCKLYPHIPYLSINSMLNQQLEIVRQRIVDTRTRHKKQKGLERQNGEAIHPEDIPGLKEAGWVPDRNAQMARAQIYRSMARTLDDVKSHHQAWPFREPVDTRIVVDYLTFIEHPMDLSTMEAKLKARKYRDKEAFIKDMQLIFDNCRRYNAPSTPYYKAADALERYFRTKLQHLK
eukprot:Clim_evm14s155 gene=Clim_evmTU14s155